MSAPLSPNAQAILLLAAPLSVGRPTVPSGFLTHAEYRDLARRLREIGKQPADLLSSEADDVLRACANGLDQERIHRLLARGLLLGQAVECWRSRGIWVITRADGDYPKRLKERLKEDAPAVLYGCGERQLLSSGGLAVVGSRETGEDLREYARSVGKLAAWSQKTLISGGARGIDQAAMLGAEETGGNVVAVLADSLARTALRHEYREALMSGRLALASPYDPHAGFHVGHAMQRNKLIYALADGALVVSALAGQGGTWAGAVEQLEKLHFVPVYVRSIDEENVAAQGLRQRGALPWPEPRDPAELDQALASTPCSPRT